MEVRKYMVDSDKDILTTGSTDVFDINFTPGNIELYIASKNNDSGRYCAWLVRPLDIERGYYEKGCHEIFLKTAEDKLK